jgi:hypothetical protein
MEPPAGSFQLASHENPFQPSEEERIVIKPKSLSEEKQPQQQPGDQNVMTSESDESSSSSSDDSEVELICVQKKWTNEHDPILVSSDSSDTTTSSDSSDNDDRKLENAINRGPPSQKPTKRNFLHKKSVAKITPVTLGNDSAKVAFGTQRRLPSQDSPDTSTSDSSGDESVGLPFREQFQQQKSQNFKHASSSAMSSRAAGARHSARPPNSMNGIKTVKHGNRYHISSSDESYDECDDERTGRRYFHSGRKGHRSTQRRPMSRPVSTTTSKPTPAPSTSHSSMSGSSSNNDHVRDTLSNDSNDSDNDDNQRSPQMQQKSWKKFQQMPVKLAGAATSNPIQTASVCSPEVGKNFETEVGTQSRNLSDWVPILDGYLDLFIHLQKEQNLCEVDRVVKHILEKNIRVIFCTVPAA